MRDGNCLFCKIVEGKIPSDIVHRSDRVVAFRDIQPQAPVHVLLIPTEHVAAASEIRESNARIAGDLFAAASEVAEKLGVDRTGYRLVVNNGADALQTVGHLHLHLLGGRPMAWPPG